MSFHDDLNDDEEFMSSTADPTFEADGNKGDDEVQEIRDRAAKDTNRIRLLRIIMSAVLLTTAIVVTLVTYRFLKRAQTSNFETAVRSFLFLTRREKGAA